VPGVGDLAAVRGRHAAGSANVTSLVKSNVTYYHLLPVYAQMEGLAPAMSMQSAASMLSARSVLTKLCTMERGSSSRTDATFYSAREGPLSRCVGGVRKPYPLRTGAGAPEL